jgi:prevent-host-death family protein
MSYTVNMHAAKTNLSKLVERACAGEEIILANNGEPRVRLVPVIQPRRQPGTLKGVLEVTDEFFAPLTDDELREWEGG